MKLIVCALADAERLATRHRPAGVVSLLSPDQPAPRAPARSARLILRCNDIVAPQEGLAAPDREMIARLLTFAEIFTSEATLMLHCWMGISRSPAAAFILACARAPTSREADIAERLRRAAPSATPNRLMVRLADEQLGRSGRMILAIDRIGRGREAATGAPFLFDTSEAQT